MLFEFFIFLLGINFGSFLSCLIYRLEKKESFIFGKSFCPHCKHPLSFFDLIPIISFFLLKGKCRYCKKKISFFYPLIEFTTGILFLIFWWHFKNLEGPFRIFTLICFWLISSFLLSIFVFDLKHYLIPDELIFSIIFILSFWLFTSYFFGFLSFFELKNRIFSAIFSTLPFLILVVISKEKWLGWGDVKLSFFLGLFLGWPKILVSLFLSYFLGSIVGIILVLLKKKSLKSEIPFAPFLILGAALSFFLGEKMISLYLNFWNF